MMTARDLVIVERQVNPCASGADIGRKVGLTRERVRQILSEEGLATTKWTPTFICQTCGQVTKKQSAFCSRKCRTADNWVDIACEVCGSLKAYLRSHIVWRMKKLGLQKHFFCGHTCQGQWLAENRGTRKYNYGLIDYLLLCGISVSQLVKHMQIPPGSSRLIYARKKLLNDYNPV